MIRYKKYHNNRHSAVPSAESTSRRKDFIKVTYSAHTTAPTSRTFSTGTICRLKSSTVRLSMTWVTRIALDRVRFRGPRHRIDGARRVFYLWIKRSPPLSFLRVLADRFSYWRAERDGKTERERTCNEVERDTQA
jgi:hypothetical protein